MRCETTDGRFVRLDRPDEWWDTTGVDIVPEATVTAHIAANPGVGIVYLQGHSTAVAWTEADV